MRDWTRAEIVARIVQEADLYQIPRRLALGCGIAESNLRQYAERYGYHTNEGAGAAERGDLAGLQRVLDEMVADGTPLDCSFGISQQIVRYAPVGNQTMTPENVLVVRAWLFDPENSIPLMVRKLAGFYFDAYNPGAESTNGDRVLYALFKYNTGRFVAPAGEFASNVANYTRALIAADNELVGYEPPEADDMQLTEQERADLTVVLDTLWHFAGKLRAKRDRIIAEASIVRVKEIAGL